MIAVIEIMSMIALAFVLVAIGRWLFSEQMKVIKKRKKR